MQVSPQKLTCFYWVLTVCQIYIKLITYFIKPQNNNANLGLWLTPLLPSYCLPKKKKKKKKKRVERQRASILLLGKEDHEMTVSWYFQTFSIKIKFVVCNRKFQSLYSCAYHENSDSLMVQYDSPVFLVQFSSVAQSCPTLCDPMNHSTPDLPVHH